MTRKIIGSLLAGALLLAIPATALAGTEDTLMSVDFKTTSKSKKAGYEEQPASGEPVHRDDPIHGIGHGPAGNLVRPQHHSAEGVSVHGQAVAEEAALRPAQGQPGEVGRRLPEGLKRSEAGM